MALKRGIVELVDYNEQWNEEYIMQDGDIVLFRFNV